MAARVRGHDWAATPLGPIALWPEGLKAVVDLVLASPLVATLAMGPERRLIYNDAAARFYGNRHPRALGRPLAEVFPESYPKVAPFYDRVFAGEAVEVAAQPLDIAGNDDVFDAYLTPVRDTGGTVVAAHMIGTEIGSRVRAEARLRTSEERLRGVLDGMTEGFGVLAPDFVILEYNAEAVRMDGRPKDTIVGRTHWDAFPGTEHSEIGRALKKAMTERRPTFVEHRYAWDEGRALWLELRAYPIHDGMLSVFWRDVTERKEAEQNLRESEERQRLTIELVPALLWSASPDGREFSLNERWTLYTGQSVAEMPDYGWLDAVHPDEIAEARAAFERAFATGEPLEREHRIRPSGGDWRWHLVRHAPSRDETGVITRWFGAAVDIHERKLAEQALMATEGRLQTLIEGVPQLVWRGVDGGKWTWASSQWTRYTGQAEPDSHGYGWLDPVHPDDRKRVCAVWDGAVERGEFHADYRIYHLAEQRYRWFQTRATPLRDEHGLVVEWLGTSTDVHDLRQLQERQGVLVAELQHRVRNILTVVRSLFQRTAETTADPEEMANHFKGRLDAMARTQVMATRNAARRIDLEDLIRDEMLSVGIADGPQFCVSGPEVPLPFSAAEPIALALHELTTNALKYGALSTDQGRVSITWDTNLGDDGGTRLHLMWQESGVPAVSVSPTRRGFGRELIEEALPYRLGANTKLEFVGNGVRCLISVDLPSEEAAP